MSFLSSSVILGICLLIVVGLVGVVALLLGDHNK